jgi:hypothetical protein
MNYLFLYILSDIAFVQRFGLFSYNEISVAIKADLSEVLFFGTLNNSSLSASMFSPFKPKFI